MGGGVQRSNAGFGNSKKAPAGYATERLAVLVFRGAGKSKIFRMTRRLAVSNHLVRFALTAVPFELPLAVRASARCALRVLASPGIKDSRARGGAADAGVRVACRREAELPELTAAKPP